MKFSVLGGQGVIGRAVVEHLRASQHTVEVPARGQHWSDLVDLGHVIYAVGLTADFRGRPHETVEAHVTVLSQLLREARFESLLYLSSTRVYMNTESTAETAPLCVAPADPSNLYNLSKLLGEALCLADPRPTVRVARLSNVVGGQDDDSDNFIPSLKREARAGCIRLQTAPNSAKDYIHIDDVAALLPRIAVGGRQRLYNVASGSLVTHAEWVAHICAEIPCAVEVAAGAPQVMSPAIDVRRLQAEFPHTPRLPWASRSRTETLS